MSSIDFNKTESILDSEIVDNNVHVKLQEITSKLMFVEKEKLAVEREKQEMQSSYDAQRAKYQKLYLQKEEEVNRMKHEIDELKTQLLIAQMNETRIKEETIQAQEAQISELSQIVRETVEESTSSQSQVRNLQKAIHTLEDQLAKLTSEKSDSILLAPSNMLSATKSFAKKVVSQLGTDLDRSADSDLEDNMIKASREAEFMRSLVLPLEQTIKELEEKLSNAEEQLQRYENKKGHPESLGGDDALNASSSLACGMCANYEAQLCAQQQLVAKLRKQGDIAETNLEKFKDDLAKETQFRKQMEDKWNEKKEEQKLQVAQLKDEVVTGKRGLIELQNAFTAMCKDTRAQLERLVFDREEVNQKMVALLIENENLVGKHNKHSQALMGEDINFPDNVEELQEVLIKLHEDLIAAVVAKETKEELENTLRYEIKLLETQMETEQSSRAAIEESLSSENSSLRHQSDKLIKENNRLKTDVENLMVKEIRYRTEISNLKEQLQNISGENRKNSEVIMELRSCVASLQKQLDGGEATQKDFVRLSQSLQVELEKLRGADTEVRWQHEDDVSDCQGCKQQFASSKKKSHCRHCGKIFCSNCLQHSVLSGPNQRSCRVCQVCHTLLNRDTAPYFSQEPPHSPD